MSTEVNSEMLEIGKAVDLQQVSMLEIECAELDMESTQQIPTFVVRRILDRLYSNSLETSKILQELGSYTRSPANSPRRLARHELR
jgi:hypothetical protein